MSYEHVLILAPLAVLTLVFLGWVALKIFRFLCLLLDLAALAVFDACGEGFWGGAVVVLAVAGTASILYFIWAAVLNPPSLNPP